MAVSRCGQFPDDPARRRKMAEIRSETVCFTNMCMVEDGSGNVAALDKIKGGYTGLTFPGGHLEEGETFYEAVIREVFEETGLEIRNPVFSGVYHWKKDGIHNVILLYKATEFSGTLKNSDEGRVFWVPLEEFKKMDLAEGTEHVITICCGEGPRECFMQMEDGKYRGYLF